MRSELEPREKFYKLKSQVPVIERYKSSTSQNKFLPDIKWHLSYKVTLNKTEYFPKFSIVERLYFAPNILCFAVSYHAGGSCIVLLLLLLKVKTFIKMFWLLQLSEEISQGSLRRFQSHSNLHSSVCTMLVCVSNPFILRKTIFWWIDNNLTVLNRE